MKRPSWIHHSPQAKASPTSVPSTKLKCALHKYASIASCPPQEMVAPSTCSRSNQEETQARCALASHQDTSSSFCPLNNGFSSLNGAPPFSLLHSLTQVNNEPHPLQRYNKVQRSVSDQQLAKHAPIALTLLDRLHWQPHKHSRIKESDASPSGILNTFLIHTTTSKLTRYSMFNLVAHIDITHKHVVASKISKTIRLSPMCSYQYI
jgi:hypothetical protein